MSKATIAIVGRPNVGKSTLFNRIIRQMLAIVEDTPGVTRDRIYGSAEWLGNEFSVIDTGGIQVDETDTISTQMKNQAQIAIEEADVIIFVVDAREGVTPADDEVANILRRSRKPVILAANKVEGEKVAFNSYDFYSLGFGEPIQISSAHGLNIGDLLDEVVSKLPKKDGQDYPESSIRIAVIGRPNVGKSSLVNAILGEERVIVSSIPGTTRDAIDTMFLQDGQEYIIVDTAGMRRKGRIDIPIERYSVIRALRAVDNCDVALIVIDAEEGITEQDTKIAGYAHEAGKASIIVVNKWDLIAKDDHTVKNYEAKIRDMLPFMSYAPIIFISALTKKRLQNLLPLVNQVGEQHRRKIPTSLLNDVISEAVIRNQPPSEKGKRLKIFYATQAKIKPPTFVFFMNDPTLFHFSYERYLENKIRESFGFEGTPVTIVAKKRG